MKRPTGGCKWAPRAPPGGAPLAREVCARREPGPSPWPEVPTRLTWGGTGLRGFLEAPALGTVLLWCCRHRTAHPARLGVTRGCRTAAMASPTHRAAPSPRTQPRLAPAAHKPSAQAQPLRNTPGKLRYGLFLSSPDFVGTLPYSLLTAGKTSAQSFVGFLNIYIYIYIRVCVGVCICTWMDIHTHTHTPWLSNISLSCTTNS